VNQFQFKAELSFDEERRIVSVVAVPVVDSSALNRDSLMHLLVSKGFSDHFLFDENINQFLEKVSEYRTKGQEIFDVLLKRLQKQCKLALPADSDEPASVTANLPAAGSEQDLSESIKAEEIYRLLEVGDISIDIAERKDATIGITVAEDCLAAFLNITPAFGGRLADRKAVLQALSKSGIEVDVFTSVIDKAVEQGECINQLVAKGLPPRKGKDSQFETLVKDQIRTEPVIDEQGNANYFEVNEFIVVNVGDELMRRSPPGQGRGGKDVFGRSIPADPGDVLPFLAGLEGVEVSPQDCNLLIAADKGHPVIFDRGVAVDPVLHLKNVNLVTGNVDFDGSVHIAEDVADSMVVKATGDVVVGGVVGKATIKAGNNVVIQQGLIGGSVAEDADQKPVYGAEVTAGGGVSARFITMTKVHAGTEITVAEYVTHSYLVANNRVVVGETSGRGKLIGGYAQAFDEVSAKVLGSEGSVLTKIRVGAAADTVARLRHITQIGRQKRDTAAVLWQKAHMLRLRLNNNNISGVSEDKLKQLERELEALKKELTNCKSKEQEFKKLLLRSKQSRIIGKVRVHQNVCVDILGSGYRTREDTAGGSFSFDIRRVVFNH